MKKEKKEEVNAALRQWTRGVSFTLAMGKTQVAVLVSIHASQGRRDLSLLGSGHKALKYWATAADGLIDRGLVRHHPWASPAELQSRKKYGEIWEVTPAGEHVVALLKMTGIYDELRAEFERYGSISLRSLKFVG